ncbi:glycoside hydrolase family 28 protein [Sphingomonas pruni]|uniref:glycoside hydrolase family 28 protein n=1 Tax=Sphingomonas pruni TaxID=40683 RepID=UPI00082E17D1|nr:glycoside hydrolase family 28 protein [Sphingomonas pruni]
MRLNRRELIGTGAAAMSLLALPGWAAIADPWVGASEILARIRPPRIPARSVSIVEHGAKGDGVTLNSRAFAAAIAALSSKGGGRVIVPAGRFLTGPIHLDSNIELHVGDGATILFSTDPADFPIVLTRFEGVEMMGLSPLIYAHCKRNVAITGTGTLDGQGSGQHWWSWKGPWKGTVDGGWRDGMPDQRAARRRLFDMAERRVPVEKRIFGASDYLRPAFIEPHGCDNVLIEGVKLRGAPFWQVHPVLCRNVIVRNLDILGHGPNNDGCDPESCTDVLIENVLFDTGDDCIAVKSGRNEDGRRVAVPSRNFVIRDCTMREGHGGITIGSEISGGCGNVFAERCTMDSPNLDYAIRFKNNAMRGGLLEGFHYRDIAVGEVKRAVIACDFNYEEGAKGAFTPALRDVTIERIAARRSIMALDAQGLPNAPIERVRLSDCAFDGVTRPSRIAYTNGLVLDRVRVNGAPVTQL